MRFFDRLKAFFNRNPHEHETLQDALPDGAHLNAVALPDDAGDLPDWIRIVSEGAYPNHPDGSHEITRAHLEEMLANFERESTDLFLDYDHDSVFRGDTRASGWSSSLELREDGLYMRRPEWTSSGERAVNGRDYRYLSPVYVLDSDDKQGDEAGAYLHSVALTNAPYLNEGEIDAIGNAAPPPTDADTDNATDSNFMDRQELIEKLGLDEDASDDDINEALTARANARNEEEDPEAEDAGEDPEPEADEEPDASEEDAGEDDDVDAKVNAAVARALAERDDADRAERLVNSAVADFKINRSDKDVWLNSAKADLEGTRERLDAIDEGAAKPDGVTVNSGGGARPQPSSKMLDYVNDQAG